MKKIFILFAAVGLVALSSCEGDQGPPGEPGVNIVGTVYENTSSNYYNFTSTNNYTVGFDFPTRLIESDVVLVYRFDGVDSANKPVWQALPETYYLADGTRDFSLKYIFTEDYVDIYLDGNNPATIPADYRVNQIFRIVVVPADFAASVNKSSYLDVTSKMNLKESQIQEIKL
jgi:hypothetical protein